MQLDSPIETDGTSEPVENNVPLIVTYLLVLSVRPLKTTVLVELENVTIVLMLAE